MVMAHIRSNSADEDQPREANTATRSAAPATNSLHPRLLLIVRDQATAVLLTESLTGHFDPRTVHLETCVSDALQQDLEQYDLVFLDGSVSGDTALRDLTALLEQQPELPVAVSLPPDALDLAAEFTRIGACDCLAAVAGYAAAAPLLIRKNLEQRAISSTNQPSALERARYRNRRLQMSVRRLRALARTDALTSLDNRRSLTRVLRSSFAQATRYGQDLACLMIDLDNFKRFNDSLGHQAGDQLLQRAARIIQANCRSADIAGRYGGDEFLVILPQTDLETAEQVGKRISQVFESEVRSNTSAVSAGLTATMSIGVATLHQSGCSSAQQLVSCADRALYRSKKGGKSRLSVYHTDTATSAA